MREEVVRRVGVVRGEGVEEEEEEAAGLHGAGREVVLYRVLYLGDWMRVLRVSRG
jgi:hypothetical protein